MKRIILTITVFFAALSTWGGDRVVCVSSLLEEMIDRDVVAYYPSPAYSCRQASSYDRRTVAKDKNEWFANVDRSFFIRTEYNNGRREYVMMDETGPGTIVRFWMTFAGPGSGQGTLRIYLDGSDTPAIEGQAMKVLSGGMLAPAPLSDSESHLTQYEKRGHDLYLPIPYAKGCKVTYETDNLEPDKFGARKPEDEKIYYNINFRTYAEGTAVKTFSLEDLKAQSSLIEHVCAGLASEDKQISGADKDMDISCNIAPGDSAQFDLTGASAIRKIAMNVKAADREAALRALVMEIVFDGERTVWVPVGDFFGIGYRSAYTSTWYNKVKPDALMESYWLMPFKKDCKITFRNLSAQEISLVDAAVSYGKFKWTKDSMHFGVSWHQYTNVLAGPHEKARDMDFATLVGQGVYMGDGVVLYNTADKWWGEGDEKVFVDWEEFPSHIGTGSEDYYGYAWSKPEIFTGHPFIAQPVGEGAQTTGYVCNTRYRCLDRIPFREALNFDLELFHWAETRIDYAPTSYWYLKPSGRTLIGPDERGATAKLRGAK